jgi:hypothetical protein
MENFLVRVLHIQQKINELSVGAERYDGILEVFYRYQCCG